MEASTGLPPGPSARRWDFVGGGGGRTGAMRPLVPAELLHAWLAGRSLARGLPAPVVDRGGFRVDTAGKGKVARWVLPCAGAGVAALWRTIDTPGYVIKACDEVGALRAFLPARWEAEATGYFMVGSDAPSARPVSAGYVLTAEERGAATTVRITAAPGEPAASGHAVRSAGVFVYDRIVI